jgi:hypothetical protein
MPSTLRRSEPHVTVRPSRAAPVAVPAASDGARRGARGCVRASCRARSLERSALGHQAAAVGWMDAYGMALCARTHSENHASYA